MLPRIVSLAFTEIFRSKRSRGHVVVGCAGIILASFTLIIIGSFSDGVARFTAESYRKSRSILGSVIISKSSLDSRFTYSQKELLDSLVESGSLSISIVDSNLEPKLDYRNCILVRRYDESIGVKIFNDNSELIAEYNTAELIEMHQMEVELLQIEQKNVDKNEKPLAIDEIDQFENKVSQLTKVLEPYWTNKLPQKDESIIIDMVLDIIGHRINGVLGQITWVSQPYQPEIYINPDRPMYGSEAENLFVASVSPESPIFREDLGFQLIYGDLLSEHPQGKLHLGALLNMTFLEEYYGRNESELNSIRSGDGIAHIPQFIYMDFPSVIGDDGRPLFERERKKIKVVGLFDINDGENFPHLFLTEDQAQAFFYQGAEKWSDSYVNQFYNYMGEEPLEKLSTDILPRKYKKLPSKIQMDKGRGQIVNGKTRFEKAYLHIDDEHLTDPNSRNVIKRFLEAEKHLLIIRNSDAVGHIKEGLDEGKVPAELRIELEDYVLAKEPINEELYTLPRLGNYEVTSDDSTDFRRWKIVDNTYRDAWLVRHYSDSLIVSKVSGFDVMLPSQTVVSTLNRIQRVVNTYDYAITRVVLGLTFFITFLFGFAHYFRKRKDFGLLKASGMAPSVLFSAFVIQVVFVCLLGYLIGLIIAFVSTYPLEAFAADIISQFDQKGGEIGFRLLKVGWSRVFISGGLVLAAAMLGSILTAIMTARVRPIEDLNTGV